MTKHPYSRWCGCQDCLFSPDEEERRYEEADEEYERRKDNQDEASKELGIRIAEQEYADRLTREKPWTSE